MSDNEPLTNAELAILELAGYQPAGGGNLAGDGVIILRFRKDGRFFTDTRGGWRTATADFTRLIAAAPELLTACEAAYNALKSYQYGNSAPELAEEVADMVLAALAAVRGGE